MSDQHAMREHMEMMHRMHAQKLWVHFANILLGCWLLTCPFTLGYLDHANFGPGAARVTMERMLAPPEQRMLAMYWSDIASGVLIVVFGTWCTVCLLSALAMALMLPYTFDELVAMFEFLLHARRAGKPLWPLFWHGGPVPEGSADPSPPLELSADVPRRTGRQATALPKAQVISAALGIWLMFTRLTLGAHGHLADSDHLTGATVFVISVCAFAEVARPLRWLNIPLALWLLASPWVLSGATLTGVWANMIVAGVLMALAVPRGPVRHRYAAWDRYLAW